MKLIIEVDGVKRLITGSFAMCCSRDDLQSIRAQIDNVLCCDRSDGHLKFSYGWFNVYSDVPSIVSGAPIDWKEGVQG